MIKDCSQTAIYFWLATIITHIQRLLFRLNFFLFGRNHFAEVSKKLGRYINLKIISLDHKSSYVGNSSMMNNTAKDFDIL